MLVQEMLCLSDEQVHDIMFLRRVCFLRRHQVHSQRAALQAKAQEPNLKPFYAVSKLKIVAKQLQHNTAVDVDITYRFSRAMYFGVSLCGKTTRLYSHVDCCCSAQLCMHFFGSALAHDMLDLTTSMLSTRGLG